MALIFLTGGARGGKSARAVLMAATSGRDVTFVATAQARDAEMSDRIRLHRDERPADWATVEAPFDLEPAVAELGGGICRNHRLSLALGLQPARTRRLRPADRSGSRTRRHCLHRQRG